MNRLLAFACAVGLCAAITLQPLRGAQAGLRWSPCSDLPQLQCSWIVVPIDPASPQGANFRLRIARVPAINPARKLGVLVFLPGGPGAGIKEMFGGNREANRVDDLRRDYDVVTFDPRGIGKSSPIRCSPQTVPRAKPPDIRPPSTAAFEAMRAANAALLKTCFALTGPLMSHLSSADVAADVERIRLALTPKKGLIAYGGSYGTAFGAAYLERYGNHVQALVLDGVVDHSIDLRAFMSRNVLSVQDEFDRFVRWCGAARACALHGRDVGRVFDAVAVKAPETRTLVPQLLAAGSDPQFGWPMLAKLLAQVQGGNRSTLNALTRAVSLGSTAEDPQVRAGKNGLFPGVLCSDYGPQNDYAAFYAASVAIARRAPRFAWKFWDATPLAHASAGVGDCVGWPLPARNPPHRLSVPWHSDIMVANPTYDPATPLANALSVWLQIPGSRLLIADADGHQSWIVSNCAFLKQKKFLAKPASVLTTDICAK